MARTLHAIILAAGFGSRLDAAEGHKILAQVGARPLLDYHLENFARLGVSHVTVVTGYEREVLQARLEEWPLPEGMSLHVAYNPDFKTSNGVSILAGVDKVLDEVFGCQGPFWLTMSDHLLEPALVDHLAEGFADFLDPRWQGVLGVDYKLDTIFDMPDANKVQLGGREPGATLQIGKNLEVFDAIDVGLFWCGRGFVDALRGELAARGDCNTSDAVRRLTASGEFGFWDVEGHLWQDVDTPGAHAHAERLIVAWER